MVQFVLIAAAISPRHGSMDITNALTVSALGTEIVVREPLLSVPPVLSYTDINPGWYLHIRNAVLH